MKRCTWVKLENNLEIDYHDCEWGVPITDDTMLFEFLTLEGAQAGLSWTTVLKKKENYRQAFANFDPEIVAKFDENIIQELLQNPGIIRNKLKVRSAITNAQKFLKVKAEYGSFTKYIWQFVDYKPIQNNWKTQLCTSSI
ncbi:MAG: DNA-3-methyladenine glycosylase I [Xenococcaceae cyanobacterium MO_188.B29]|nr:DNA-3-methyladenine glycosylase I [Xenococcaceae cyanobacterium MO_188.B29]